MGLNFISSNRKINTDVGWTYVGFSFFREQIAESVGIELDEMIGFCKCNYIYSYKRPDCIDCKKYKSLKKWDDIKDDIKLFLYHSDCDGEVTSENLEKVAPRLKDILVNNFSDEDRDKKKGLELVAFMEKCIETNSSLIFC